MDRGCIGALLHVVDLMGRLRPSAFVPIWYSPRYRLPLSSLEGQRGIEPRRADYVLWYLRDARALRGTEVRAPERASYEQMARVHGRGYLESLTRAPTLARIFATDPTDMRVDEVLLTVRLACGATIAAAREALRLGTPMLNLLGGFHHAGPARGGGLCAVNDIAVAIAAVRAEGFTGRACVLDLDAHPPDGTAACFEHGLGDGWIGSLSGSDWGPLPGVDEVLLPEGCGDQEYLRALEALLARMPHPDLAFVIAGGDVLEGDLFGRLGLTLAGARRRDLRLLEALADVPSVWLPGGGYHPDGWRVLAGTALALLRGSASRIPPRYDPLTSRFARIASRLETDALRGGTGELSEEDLEFAFGGARRPRLLEYYTTEGLEYALFEYGIFDLLRRLGYNGFRGEIGPAASGGDQVRLWARAKADPTSEEVLLIDCALERQRVAGHDVLYVHWLTLRNPRASFSALRPKLPGQEVPGLGLARETVELMARIAGRLHFAGVAYRPAWYHTAWPARHRLRFVDAARQGRFEALARDLAGLPLLEASLAVSEGRVHQDPPADANRPDQPYKWEAEPMVLWLDRAAAPEASAAWTEAARAERERVRYTVTPHHVPLPTEGPSPAAGGT